MPLKGEPVTYRKKLIEVALPLDDINREAVTRKIHPPRTPIHVAPLVGATTISSAMPSSPICLTRR